MAATVLYALSVLLLLATCHADDDKQRWSINAKNGDSITLMCQDSFNWTKVSSNNRLVWRKKDHGIITSGNVYTFRREKGMDKMAVDFKVSGATNGIYFCDVMDTMSTPGTTDDKLVGVIIKGVNVGVREYEDFLDRYEDDLIVGAIAAASVFVLVVSIGLLNHLKYHSDEQLEKRRNRKAEHVRRHHQPTYNGYDNTGISMDDTPPKQYNGNENDGRTSF